MSYSKCERCGTEKQPVSCPDGRAGCLVLHIGCFECRKIPCDVCGEGHQPGARYGICESCEKAAVVYSAQLAHAAKLQNEALKDLSREV